MLYERGASVFGVEKGYFHDPDYMDDKQAGDFLMNQNRLCF